MSEVQLIHLPTAIDDRGNLTYIESTRTIPFDIKRIFYIYNVPKRMKRGGHAHKECEQVLIAARGSFSIETKVNNVRAIAKLYKPNLGLYISSKVYVTMTNFTQDAVCLVLASMYYDDEDFF